MNYQKHALTIDEQIIKLKNRGLKFEDDEKAKNYLSNISYYRLRAYTYPFQDNSNPNHPFIVDISFEKIIDIYVFDRRLRMLIFNAIEKIEIAFRTKIIYKFSLKDGSHWFENPSNYKDIEIFSQNISKLKKEVDRSTETFIKHYRRNYNNPITPPAWMSLEVVSIGLLSKIFKDIKTCNEKKEIAKDFGLPKIRFLENWLQSLTQLRNLCAHHSRIWNRRFINSTLIPHNTTFQFLSNVNIHNNELYIQLSLIIYLLRIISPGSDFVINIKNLISEFNIINTREMGFPDNWLEEEIWK